MEQYALNRIGTVRSPLMDRKNAPRQGYEGAPDAVIEIQPEFVRGLDGVKAGDDVVVLTWLHQGQRDVLEVRPRKDPRNPIPACSRRARRTGRTRSACTA